MDEYFYLNTDNVIRVRNLKDVVTGAYINDAVITATVYTSAGVVVPGAQNISLVYVTGTDGDYAGEIPNTVTLTAGAEYYALLSITGSGYKTTLKVTRTAKYKAE